MLNHICPYCGSANKNGQIGDIFCSNYHSNLEELENGFFKLSLDGSDLTDNHFTRLSIRLVEGGSQRYYVNKKEKLLTPDRALLMNLGQQYRLQSMENASTTVIGIAFNPKFVSKFLYDYSQSEDNLLENIDGEFKYDFIDGLSLPSFKLHSIIKRLRENPEKSAFDNFQLHEIYTELLTEIVRNEEELIQKSLELKKVKKSTSLEVIRRLHLAKDYIESCFQQIQSVSEVADVASMSEFHFYRSFKAYFKTTPHQLLQQKKLELSKELICSTNYSIAEVCDLVGYKDQSSFTRLFKNHFQYSPTKIRSSIKKAEFA